MVPEMVMPLEELPRLPNGKINRRGLPEPDFANRDQSEFAEPKGQAEERIQEIWQEVSPVWQALWRVVGQRAL